MVLCIYFMYEYMYSLYVRIQYCTQHSNCKNVKVRL